MKILFVTKIDFGLRIGGVQIQILKLKRLIESRGNEVILYNSWENSFKEVDICHIFTSSPETFPVAQSAKRNNIPIVITPIFNTEDPKWKWKLKIYSAFLFPGLFSYLKVSIKLLRLADMVLPLTLDELNKLNSIFSVRKDKMQIVPNGVDERFGESTDKLFFDKYGFKPDVLFVGRIDRNKNILGLINSLKGMDLKLAVIGFPYDAEPDVFEIFMKNIGNNVIYIGSLQHDDPMLASAYAASKVFCLPSFKEVMPLTVLEAYTAGCRVVLTKNSAVRSEMFDKILYINPYSQKDIKNKIMNALESSINISRDKQTINRYSWAKIGDKLLDSYSKLIEIKNNIA